MRPVHVLAVVLAAGAAFGGGYAIASSGGGGEKTSDPDVAPASVQSPAIAVHRQSTAVPALAPAPVRHVSAPVTQTPRPSPAPSTGGGSGNGGGGGIIQG
jgi:hypothetical protein